MSEEDRDNAVQTETLSHAIEEAVSPSTPEKRKPFLRLVLLVLVLIAASACLYFLPIREWLGDSGKVKQAISSLGMWTYPVCILASAMLVCVGVSRLILCFLSGVVLGFLPGLIVVQIGTMLGYYAMFLFVRWGGRDFVLHKWPGLQKWAGMIQNEGVFGVILARQLPIHGTLVNLCLGLTKLRHRDFLIGSAIGMIPEAIPTTLFGAGMVKGDGKTIATYITIAIIIFAAIGIGARYMLKKMRKK